MKTYLDCIPCFFKQALEAARIAGATKKMQKRILNELAKILPEFALTSSPPEMGRTIHNLVKKITQNGDPYARVKEKSNKLALGVYNKLKKKINYSQDKLLMAIELAIAGNIIDYGVKNSLDVGAELKKILDEENKIVKKENKAIFNYSKFKHALGDAQTILYLADNAGEVVFDRVLIEEIRKRDKNKKVIYAVKKKPIINDALRKDAYRCKIYKVAEIISCGSDAPGTILSLCSKKFLKVFKEADLVISKGQGNFEALSNTKRPVFFLFMAKCPIIAEDVSARVGDCKVGDINLFYHPGSKAK